MGVHDVLDHQRTPARAVARIMAGNHCHWDIDELAVEQSRGPHALGRHVDSDLTVNNVQGLVGPTPVPNLQDGRLGFVEGEVAHRILLVAKLSAVLAPDEDQVCQESAATLFHEDACMGVFGPGRQLEHTVLDRGRLRRGPMDGGDLTGDISGVENQISDLPEEDVRADK